MTKQMVVIINASAGSGCTDAWADQLRATFLTGGQEADIIVCQSGAEIIDAAQRALQQEVLAIVAGGGDGTVSAIASVLIGQDVALGILPMGTLNHFAKDMHIPLETEPAVHAILAGHSTWVDTGSVNGRSFINNSSLGIYPDIVRDREKQQRRLGRGKWLAFAWATLTALRRYPFLNVQLNLNNQEHQRNTPFIFIGNNEYLMSGFTIGERACLNQGRLSLYVAQRPGRLGLLQLALSALLGRLRQAKHFDILEAQEITVQTRRKRLRVALDGEVTVLATPLCYRINPHSLRVLVPIG